jgi:hypothetical protein
MEMTAAYDRFVSRKFFSSLDGLRCFEQRHGHRVSLHSE